MSLPMILRARDLLSIEACQAVTAVERMARRWYLEPGVEQRHPDLLLAPRFADVPPLRVPAPDSDQPLEVHVTGWCLPGWFNHLRVRHPGSRCPVTLAHPTFNCRPGVEAEAVAAGAAAQWTTYALTIPPHTPWIEISKGTEVEAALVEVRFSAADSEPAMPLPWSEPPRVVALVDLGILVAETLQAHDFAPVQDFLHQMADMGFTHFFDQVAHGSAGWSHAARRIPSPPPGHRSKANWCLPEDWPDVGVVAGTQRLIDGVRRAGMKYVASYRINNEWLAEWAIAFYHGQTPYNASQFSVDHPELWHTYKSGQRTGSGLDFSFEAVRQQRLQVIGEWCDLFHDFDGLCLDLQRHPPMVSYPEHLVQQFQQQTGIDVRTVEPVDLDTLLPQWLQFRAQPFTQFVKLVRAELQTRYGDAVQLSARIGNTLEVALFDGADVASWLDEKLVDLLLLQHHRGRNAVDADSRPIIELARRQGVPTVHMMELLHQWVERAGDEGPGAYEQLVRKWAHWGSGGLGFYEAERVARDGNWFRRLPRLTR